MSYIKFDTIVLSPELRMEADNLGDARFVNNRKRAVQQNKEGRMGNDPDTIATFLVRDRRGVRGEMAFALMTEADQRSWSMIRSIGVQSVAQGTDPADVVLVSQDGIDVAVDVKTTEYARGRLLIGTEKVHANTVYVLVYEDFLGRFHYKGATTFERATALLNEGIATLKSRDTIWVEAKDLIDIETCVAEIAAKTAARLAARRG